LFWITAAADILGEIGSPAQAALPRLQPSAAFGTEPPLIAKAADRSVLGCMGRQVVIFFSAPAVGVTRGVGAPRAA
jgi:hypothetical protein